MFDVMNRQGAREICRNSALTNTRRIHFVSLFSLDKLNRLWHENCFRSDENAFSLRRSGSWLALHIRADEGGKEWNININFNILSPTN